MKKKIYLEPKCDFDEFILEETETDIKYDGWKIVAYFIKEFKTDGMSQEDAEVMGIEWFDFNVEPLSLYYNVSFQYPDESDLGNTE